MEGGMPIRPKSLDSAIMVSDFITKDGWILLTLDEQQDNPTAQILRKSSLNWEQTRTAISIQRC